MEKLRQIQEEISNKVKVINLLSWDMKTGGSVDGMGYRIKMITDYSVQIANLIKNKENEKILDDVKNSEQYKNDFELQREHYLVKKAYDRSNKLPIEFVKKYSEAVARANQKWEEARAKNDFELFRPNLEEVVKLTKESIEHRGYEGHPYNALIDEYEEGMTVEVLDAYFNKLKEKLVPLVKKINEKKKKDISYMFKKVSKEKQVEFSKKIMEYIGFNFSRGILKESVHPFTMGVDPTDVRITNRYDEQDFKSSILTAVHEGGHGIYEQNIDEKYNNTVLGQAVSLGIHESQSRFYEMIIGSSYAFWESYYKILKESVEEFKDISLDDFYYGLNYVENSLIRVDADELTYSLHIIIRYEIEKLLIEGKIEVKDLPEVWNKKVKEYLSVDVDSDKNGVLQDVHWSQGSIGYFPTYSLGSAYSAQFFNKMKEDFDVINELKNGNMEKIKTWLNENIHKYGSLYTPSELIKKATGEEFNSDYYINYLYEKYTKLYGLEI